MQPAAAQESIEVILVSPRNPLNIGAVARAMANFGLSRLTVAAPYVPHWREARSAVGAPDVLAHARETSTLAEAVAGCTYVLGTGTLTHRKPDQPVLSLPDVMPRITPQLLAGGRIALVFGPEKHGLTRDDLSWCHALIEIPTDPRQPSMNLGQAAAVCFYEITTRLTAIPPTSEAPSAPAQRASSEMLELVAGVVEQAMDRAGYSPGIMQPANRHDLRVLLRKLALSHHDARRILGLFRRILFRLPPSPTK